MTMLPYVATHVARYFLPAHNHNTIPRTITILLVLPNLTNFDSEGRRGGRQKSLYDSLLDGFLLLAEILRCVHAHWVTELPTIINAISR